MYIKVILKILTTLNLRKKKYIKVFDKLDKDIESKNKIRNENQI